MLGRSIPDLRRVVARFGLMRMASMWIASRGAHARVFRDEDSAKEWLLEADPAP